MKFWAPFLFLVSICVRCVPSAGLVVLDHALSDPWRSRLFAERDLLRRCTRGNNADPVEIERLCNVLVDNHPTAAHLKEITESSHWRVVYDAYTPEGCRGYQTVKDSFVKNEYKKDDGSSYVLECNLEAVDHETLKLVEPSRAMLVEADGSVKSMQAWTRVGVAAFKVMYMHGKLRIQRGVSTGHIMVMIKQSP